MPSVTARCSPCSAFPRRSSPHPLPASRSPPAPSALSTPPRHRPTSPSPSLREQATPGSPSATDQCSNPGECECPAKLRAPRRRILGERSPRQLASPRPPQKPPGTPPAQKKPKPVTLACSDGIAVTASKHAGGRPTKYDPAYCDLAVDLGRAGKSGEGIACHIGVVYPAVLNWQKEHPEFLEAMTLAKQLELLWWGNAGQEHLTTTGFSASAWSRSMAARFPNKWREKTQVDHGVSNELAALLGDLDGHGASIV